MLRSRYQLWALPWVGFVNNSSHGKGRLWEASLLCGRNYWGVSSSPGQKGEKQLDQDHLSPEEPPGLFVFMFGRFGKIETSEKRVCQWVLGLMEQELQGGNNTRQQGAGKMDSVKLS